MDAKEMMIGDWVLVNSTPMQIQAINDIDGEIMADDELYCLIEDRVHSEDKIEPIPLTAEILEKNGWKWNTFYTMIELVVGTIHIGWGFYKDCISVSDHSDEGHCQISSLRCEYVHELQRALRCCGLFDKANDIVV